MRARRWTLGLSILLLAGSLACRQGVAWPTVREKVRQTFPAVSQLSTEELAGWLETREEAPLLLDIRQREEFAVSHLPGAQQLDPELRGEALLTALPAELDRETPIVAYCSVGYRSSALAERLMAAGFTRVYNLEGSIFAWANEGRAVVREGEEVRQVHPFDSTWGRLLRPELHSNGER